MILHRATSPPFSVVPIANWFVLHAYGQGVGVNAVQVQKLVYLAAVRALTTLRADTFAIPFSAAPTGPVSLDLYAKTSPLELAPIDRLWFLKSVTLPLLPREEAMKFAHAEPIQLLVEHRRTERVLLWTWEAYGALSADELVEVARASGGAWATAWNEGRGYGDEKEGELPLLSLWEMAREADARWPGAWDVEGGSNEDGSGEDPGALDQDRATRSGDAGSAADELAFVRSHLKAFPPGRRGNRDRPVERSDVERRAP